MLRSLDHILGAVENQPQLQGPQQFQCLLKGWAEVVGATVAQQTRPYSIVGDVLCVATSSAVWSQELKFKRRQILKALNARLSSPLVDIRFSSAHWHQDATTDDAVTPAQLWHEHPSQVGEAAPGGQEPKSTDPKAAFQQWAALKRARSLSFPLCPQCQCPTPLGELQRWQVCGLCAAKQWQA